MRRECWVYPSDGSAPYLQGTREPSSSNAYPTIMPDLPDFVSPIDNQMYSGRAGLREHNMRHNVVPTADLAGLPNYTMNGLKTMSKQEQADRKGALARIVNQHWSN